MTEAVRARVDGAGLLVAAEEPFATLNTRAGGGLGVPLAVPQLAALARLVAAMQVPLSRSILAADDDCDIEFRVHAKPIGSAQTTGVDFEITNWEPRPSRPSWLVGQYKAVDAALPRLSWQWQTDAGLIVRNVTVAPGDDTELAAACLGHSLTRLVRLVEADDGDLPILTALAEGRAFAGQRAVRRDMPNAEFELSADAVRDAAGRFVGFDGRAAPLPSVMATVADDIFGERLSRALRAPLDRIVARAETISAQADGPLRRDYANYAVDIASAGRHLLALVADLADLQAVERPGFAVGSETIDLADLTRRVAGLLSVRAADRRIRIDRSDPDEVLEAQGDFRRTLQILVNLVGNAVRYSPEGAMIWLRSERDTDSAIVVVADQGKGIALADQVRIFEKFERVDPGEPDGSGLGLYISRRLARAMGGDITVDSAPGQGARFVLTLPIAR